MRRRLITDILREMRRILLVVVVATAGLAASACGGKSSADDAKAKACGAVTDMKTQITSLKGLSTGSTSIDEAKTALDKMKTDLQTIQTEAPKTEGGLKQQLEAANEAFKADLQQVAQDVGAPGSLADAATALSGAADRLSTSYQKAFAGVGC